jgi:glutaredoxin-like protein NrdH
MQINHVAGMNRGKVILYALSTCIWCQKTKRLLHELGVEFDYIDVDLTSGSDQEEVMTEVRKYNPNGSFPTIVINNSQCIKGFQEMEIREALG